jgi:hypothetical protein
MQHVFFKNTKNVESHKSETDYSGHWLGYLGTFSTDKSLPTMSTYADFMKHVLQYWHLIQSPFKTETSSKYFKFASFSLSPMGTEPSKFLVDRASRTAFAFFVIFSFSFPLAAVYWNHSQMSNDGVPAFSRAFWKVDLHLLRFPRKVHEDPRQWSAQKEHLWYYCSLFWSCWNAGLRFWTVLRVTSRRK